MLSVDGKSADMQSEKISAETSYPY